MVAGKRNVNASFDEHVRTHIGWHYYLVFLVSPLFGLIAASWPSSSFLFVVGQCLVLGAAAAPFIYVFHLMVQRWGTGAVVLAAVFIPMAIAVCVGGTYALGLRADGPGAGADLFLLPILAFFAAPVSLLMQYLRWRRVDRYVATGCCSSGRGCLEGQSTNG